VRYNGAGFPAGNFRIQASTPRLHTTSGSLDGSAARSLTPAMGVMDVEQGMSAAGELTQPDLRRHLVAALPSLDQGACLAPCGAFVPCGCRAPLQLD